MENVGDVWTWIAIDADSKLVVSWLVGSRDAEAANCFMNVTLLGSTALIYVC